MLGLILVALVLLDICLIVYHEALLDKKFSYQMGFGPDPIIPALSLNGSYIQRLHQGPRSAIIPALKNLDELILQVLSLVGWIADSTAVPGCTITLMIACFEFYHYLRKALNSNAPAEDVALMNHKSFKNALKVQK